jgi:hypothetical protein
LRSPPASATTTSFGELRRRALLDTQSAIARVPLFLLALLIVRGLPAALYRSTIGRRRAIAAALLQATSLPFLVTAVAIGLELDEFTPETGAALVSAGLLSVIVFPILSLGLLRKAAPTADEPAAAPRAPRSPPSTSAPARSREAGSPQAGAVHVHEPAAPGRSPAAQPCGRAG